MSRADRRKRRRYGTRTPIPARSLPLAVVDQHEAPYPENLRHITVTAMVTNRDLPALFHVMAGMI